VTDVHGPSIGSEPRAPVADDVRLGEFVRLIRTEAVRLSGPSSADAVVRIAAAHDALCDAMVRAVDSHPDETTEIAEGLLRYWAATGGRSTGRAWCERVGAASSDPGRRTRFGLYEAQLARDEDDPGAGDSIERHIAEARERHDRAMVGLGLTLLAPAAFRAGRIADAKQMASEALTHLRRGGPARTVVEALNVLGNVATVEGEQAAAFAAYEDALAIAREAGMKDVVNRVLLNLGSLSVARSNFVRAREYYTEARELAVTVGDTMVASAALTNLGVIAKAEGDFLQARRLLDQALTFKQELADARGTSIVLQGLADLDLVEGKLGPAQRRLRESLEISRSLDFSLGMISGLETFGALLARAARDFETGLRIAASADAARAATGQRRSSEDTEEFDRVVAALRTGVGEDDAQTRWDEGVELSLPDAIEQVLALPSAD
jgi:tetratricopeptide (TPR) repeat protein